MNPEFAIVLSIRETWAAHPPILPLRGNRIFTRWTDANPADPAWDDWLLVGTLVNAAPLWHRDGDGGSTFARLLTAELATGRTHGTLAVDTITLEWGLFLGDGPTEPRVSDWAGYAQEGDPNES